MTDNQPSKAETVLANLCANLYRVYIRAVELRLTEEWQWDEYAIGREWAEQALAAADIPVTPEFVRAQRLAVMREYVKDGVSNNVYLEHGGYHAGDYIRLRVERPDGDGGAAFETGIIIRVVPGAEFCPFHVYDVMGKSVMLLAEIPPQDEASLIALYEQDIENRIAQHEVDQADAAVASVMDPQHAHIGSHDAYLTEDDTDEWAEALSRNGETCAICECKFVGGSCCCNPDDLYATCRSCGWKIDDYGECGC